MTKRQRTAQVLIGLGCVVLLLGAALHLIAAYPRVSAALMKSTLDASLRDALRAVFFMIGLLWVVVTLIALIATFARSQTSRPIILICGFGLLLQVPIWVGLMGWFIGNEMFLLGAGLVAGGGVMFRGLRSA